MTPGLGVRAAARLVDAVLLTGVGFGLGSLLGFGFDWLALQLVLVLAWFVASDALLGRTPGKALLGLRVEGAGGGLPSWREAFLREVFVVLGAIPFVGPLLALAAWIAIVVTVRRSPDGRGLHDRWAGGTRVVGPRSAPAPQGPGTPE
ncbi:MAG: RDD family protein [Alphaproteobacteria bacterium]|nr:RDD family protein [Alphaproteobacteria bacterium]MCB9695998.1 RDD family protein [Alphaproteobacteria bacterium]